MKFIRYSLALATVSLVPLAASASTSIFVGIGIGSGVGSCAGSICSIASTILYLINDVAVPVLFAVAFIVFLYGIAKTYILSGGEQAAEGHKLVLWGIIGFVVMISLWGLVNIVANTFGLGGYGAPQLPSSY